MISSWTENDYYSVLIYQNSLFLFYPVCSKVVPPSPSISQKQLTQSTKNEISQNFTKEQKQSFRFILFPKISWTYITEEGRPLLTDSNIYYTHWLMVGRITFLDISQWKVSHKSNVLFSLFRIDGFFGEGCAILKFPAQK